MDNDVNGKSSIFQKASSAVLGAIDSLAGFALRGMGKDPKDFDKAGMRYTLATVAYMIGITAMALGSLIVCAPSQGGQKGSAPEKRQEIPAPKKIIDSSSGDTAKMHMAFGIRPMANSQYVKGITPSRKNANLV